eukprot:4128087-Lingulodinium_polyedra.AAC.1
MVRDAPSPGRGTTAGGGWLRAAGSKVTSQSCKVMTRSETQFSIASRSMPSAKPRPVRSCMRTSVRTARPVVPTRRRTTWNTVSNVLVVPCPTAVRPRRTSANASLARPSAAGR